MGAYTVSKDVKSGLWYCHMKGYSYIPVFGSFSEKKSESMEYAKMYNNLPSFLLTWAILNLLKVKCKKW
jgi:hypothetical protein